jgi:multidrug efflux system membrane fusion protein
MGYQLLKAHHGIWMKSHFKLLFIGILGLLLLAVFSSACSNEESKKPVSSSIPVIVSTVIEKAVPVQIRAIGNVQAYSIVSVKTMVGGEIFRVHFKEGKDVRKGDLLFTIDPRPFEAALKQAEANLARDMAQLKQAEANLAKDTAQAKNAEMDAKRYEFLIEKNVVAKQQYDQFRTNSEALNATVNADKAAIENAQAAIRADRAALENAKVQLGYCFIHSPIDGRTGNLLIQQGNVVKANDLAIIGINQINPIYVTFTVPEQNLPEIKRYMAMGKLKVEAFPTNDTKQPEDGVLSFVDNSVDTTTGTIMLKGTFANTDRQLWPGQFVNVILTLTIQPGAILIPSQAIQIGQEGQYAFVVKPDLTVEQRPIVTGRTLNNETIVEKGLQAGERVVTDGQLQLVPGAKVEVRASPGQGS